MIARSSPKIKTKIDLDTQHLVETPFCKNSYGYSLIVAEYASQFFNQKTKTFLQHSCRSPTLLLLLCAICWHETQELKKEGKHHVT